MLCVRGWSRHCIVVSTCYVIATLQKCSEVIINVRMCEEQRADAV